MPDNVNERDTRPIDCDYEQVTEALKRLSEPTRQRILGAILFAGAMEQPARNAENYSPAHS